MKLEVGNVVSDDGLTYLYVPTSLNNRLVVETYKKEAPRSEVRNGFASIGQKLNLKGLTVLVNAQLNDGTLVVAGSKAFIKEEILHTQQWAQKMFEPISFISVPFLIVDLTHVEFIQPPHPIDNNVPLSPGYKGDK
jgi:hypothetical protein